MVEPGFSACTQLAFFEVVRSQVRKMKRGNSYGLPAIQCIWSTNYSSVYPVFGARASTSVFKAWRHRSWSRPVMAENSGRAENPGSARVNISCTQCDWHQESLFHDYLQCSVHVSNTSQPRPFRQQFGSTVIQPRDGRPPVTAPVGGQYIRLNNRLWPATSQQWLCTAGRIVAFGHLIAMPFILPGEFIDLIGIPLSEQHEQVALGRNFR